MYTPSAKPSDLLFRCIAMRRFIATLTLMLCGLGPTAAAPPAPPDNALAEFTGYADRPPPEVAPRKEPMTFYPCSQCHEFWQTNETPRLLAPVHDVGLEHGQGRIWCLECHSADDRDQLKTLRGGKVAFDASWKVCGQCHSARQRDWYYGAHGKRANGWMDEPERYNCTHCHNPHQPPFMVRKPKAPPPVRAGLEPMEGGHHTRLTVWERKQASAQETQRHD